VVAATVWVGCTIAGALLGVVQSVLGRTRVSPAGPDQWWIGNALISVATGLAYGVANGVVATAAVSLAWAFLGRVVELRCSRDSGALRREVTISIPAAGALLVVPLLIGTAATPQPPRHVPVAATDAMPRLEVLPGTPPVIGDETGRQVLLRRIHTANPSRWTRVWV
jgi:hypothetical protein